ncbi:MAG: thioredoxin family protein [Desulfobacterales bacterium]|nr:MAG: thioredoxin family protein [Desulfobacterales bacterium]
MAVKLGYKNVFRDPRGYPEWHAKGLPIESTPTGRSNPTPGAEKPRSFDGGAMLWTLLGVFMGGLALNLTPCVYPLIPITVSYFCGRSGPNPGKLWANGVCYIGGLSCTNSILGVVAAFTGSLLGAVLQNPLVLGAVAAILLCLAASMFGLWELRLPYGLTQAASQAYTGYFGSFFMGLTLGVVAAPCIGPFILGLLTWVAGLRSPLLGFSIFFTLSLGLGLPLFFLAIFSGKIERLPRSGEWMIWIRKLMGWILVGMAGYFIRPLLPPTVGALALAGAALVAGVHLGWIDRAQASFRAFAWLKTAAGITGLVLATSLIVAFVLRGPGVQWQPYSELLLSTAAEQQKPVIIDFYASWCAPCRELEEVTFHDREIVGQAKRDFIMIKVDLTRKGNPDNDRLLRQYGVKGVPTVIFLDRQGRERRDLRLVDFLPAEQFLIRMADVKKIQPLRDQ